MISAAIDTALHAHRFLRVSDALAIVEEVKRRGAPVGKCGRGRDRWHPLGPLALPACLQGSGSLPLAHAAATAAAAGAAAAASVPSVNGNSDMPHSAPSRALLALCRRRGALWARGDVSPGPEPPTGCGATARGGAAGRLLADKVGAPRGLEFWTAVPMNPWPLRCLCLRMCMFGVCVRLQSGRIQPIETLAFFFQGTSSSCLAGR